MQRRYHFARQRAQLIHLSKQLVSLREAGRAISTKQLTKFRHLVKSLTPRIGTNNLRRALGTGALLLGVTFGVQAQSTPNFMEPQVLPFGVDSTQKTPYSRPVLADLDNDGDLDLMYGVYNSNYASDFAYQENTGSVTEPAFGPRQTNPFGLSAVTDLLSMSFVDLDGDGDLDILEAGFNYGMPEFSAEGDPIIIYRENTGTAMAPAFTAPQLNPWGLTTPEVEINALFSSFGDLDGDGDLDIMGFSYNGDADESGPRSYFYENITPADGAITFAAPVISPFGVPDINIIYHIPDILVDIDEDGDLDLFGTAIETDESDDTYFVTVLFVENTGTATEPAFGVLQIGANFGIDELSAEGEIVRSELADLDGDGDLDLLISSYEKGFVYYRNGFPTGTNEQRVDINLKAIPNPTSGQTSISTNQEITSIEVFDGLGRKLQSLPGNERSIDLTGLPTGTYTVKFVLPENKYAIQRIVKQ